MRCRTYAMIDQIKRNPPSRTLSARNGFWIPPVLQWRDRAGFAPASLLTPAAIRTSFGYSPKVRFGRSGPRQLYVYEIVKVRLSEPRPPIIEDCPQTHNTDSLA